MMQIQWTREQTLTKSK